MPLPVTRAIQTVDKYLSDQSSNSNFLRDGSAHLRPPDATAGEDPQKRILPAFRETWRGGPNIISPNHGAYFVAADCIWHDRNRIAPEELEAVAHCTVAAGTGEQLAAMIPLCARCDVEALPAICATSPQERNIVGLLKRARQDRVKLHRQCKNNYLHGALGLQENPYGDAGEVYKNVQQRLAHAYVKSVGAIKGQVPHQEDSLFGSIALRQSSEVRCKGGVEPASNLLGSVHISDLM
ncbi:hypothetical protein DQ04_03071070 [Trypanosoma grayi]|uniref:hypothetical protein n=1 Tax=Trypanosoma grayi TaxID=71804 RepID=UPI0004F437DD|nr:hypothetical protein DQ04_03071070 [Trypanosoma grayi]KEG11001.1 hypothetical protein DQ04_03071070 [Trypanosoma grayi]